MSYKTMKGKFVPDGIEFICPECGKLNFVNRKDRDYRRLEKQDEMFWRCHVCHKTVYAVVNREER